MKIGGTIMANNTTIARSRMNYTMPLSQAMKEAPNVSGCYQIYYKCIRMYVGKAQDGIRKRFVQYYNGTTAHYTSAQLIYSLRDDVTVKWMVIPEPEKVIEKEAYWIAKYKPEWNKQSGWGHKGDLGKASVTKKVSNHSKETGEVLKERKLISGKKEIVDFAKGAGRSFVSSAATTAVLEVGKGIVDQETVGECTEHTVSKGLEAGVSGVGAEIGGQIGSLFGPVGTAIGMIGGGVLANSAVEGAFDEVGFHAGVAADEVAEKVTDFVFDASMALGSIGDAITDNPVVNGVTAIGENIAMGVEGVFDTILGWFW